MDFETLKQRLTLAPFLAYTDYTLLFLGYMDGSL